VAPAADTRVPQAGMSTHASPSQTRSPASCVEGSIKPRVRVVHDVSRERPRLGANTHARRVPNVRR